MCASCHRSIDPPGFAMESFDPIGGFRSRYRVVGAEKERWEVRYSQGPAVDSAGVTPAGDPFAGLEEYKQLLLAQELDQVARHLVSSLLTYATGAEIEFADRGGVERVVEEGQSEGYLVRSIIHRVVQSDLFKTQ